MYKVITKKAARLLEYLNQQGKELFTFQDVSEYLGNPERSRIGEFLKDLVDRELIVRIQYGLYAIVPYNVRASEYFPNRYEVARHLVGNKDYYIGYFSALSLFELTTQPSLTVQIVVKEKFNPSITRIHKTDFQFVQKNQEKHFFGYKEKLVDQFYRVNCSVLEMTFIDCLDRPDLAGGIVEIAKGLSQAANKIDYQKLLGFAKRYDKQTVVKRLGFLLELLQIGPAIVADLLEMRSHSYALLDTTMPKEGKMISRWRLQLNEDPNTILNELNT